MAWRSLLSGLNRSLTGQPPPPSVVDVAPISSTPAVFGKLPDRADFVRIGAAGVGAFERWLEEGLEQVAGKGGAFPAAPVRLLLAGAGEAGAPVPGWSGLLVPSTDAVGRVFPVCMVRAVIGGGAAVLAERWHEQAGFFARAQALLAQSLAPTSDALTGALANWDDDAPVVSLGIRAEASEPREAVPPPPNPAALAAEMDDVAALAAAALAELARDEARAPAGQEARLDEDTAPLPILSPALPASNAVTISTPTMRPGEGRLGAATLASAADVRGAFAAASASLPAEAPNPIVARAAAAAVTVSTPVLRPSIESRPTELTPPLLHPHGAITGRSGGAAVHDAFESAADLLASAPALATLETAVGPAASGAVDHALATFLSACDAARGPARKSITVEAPTGHPALALFWIALAARKLAGAVGGPSVLALSDRVVFELVDGPASPALLTACCLGIKAGPRHWTLRIPSGVGTPPSSLPASIRAALLAPGSTLLDLLAAVP